MSAVTTADGTLVELWDDDTRTVRRWKDSRLVEERPYTPAEAAPLDEAARAALAAQRRDQILTDLVDALPTNQDYLALNSPTAAQRSAQLAALTRQVSRLIRLTTGHLDN